MNDVVESLIYEVNNMQQNFENVKSQQQDHDFYQTVKPYTEHIDSMLNEIKLHREFIIEKLKSVQYDLQNILDGVTKEGTYG
ncbi:TPA: DUF1798 family protein [Staphylococcus aureus]|nr:DUF1798 family protein [Staphylococcus aureus]